VIPPVAASRSLTAMHRARLSLLALTVGLSSFTTGLVVDVGTAQAAPGGGGGGGGGSPPPPTTPPYFPAC
jgi:hypothetical protein